MSKPKKHLPPLTTDEDAEAFIANSDLTDFDLSGMQPIRFELKQKDARLNMRLSSQLLEAIKRKAQDEGVPYQRYVRNQLEQAVQLDRQP